MSTQNIRCLILGIQFMLDEEMKRPKELAPNIMPTSSKFILRIQVLERLMVKVEIKLLVQ